MALFLGVLAGPLGGQLSLLAFWVLQAGYAAAFLLRVRGQRVVGRNASRSYVAVLLAQLALVQGLVPLVTDVGLLRVDHAEGTAGAPSEMAEARKPSELQQAAA